MKHLDRLLGAAMAALGLAVAMTGYGLGYMQKQKAGPGFLPVWVGIGILALGIAIFAVSFSKKADGGRNPFEKKEFINMAFLVGGTVAVIALTPLIGLVIPLGLMGGAYARAMGTKSVRKIAALVVFIPAAMFLIFGVGLRVQLPMGIFGR